MKDDILDGRLRKPRRVKSVNASEALPAFTVVAWDGVALCGACKREVTVQRGQFVQHGPGPGDDFLCPLGGSLVSR